MPLFLTNHAYVCIEKWTGTLMLNQEMLEKISNGRGFIAALDQSGGSTPRALLGYGIDDDAYSSDEEMFGLIHAMRARIISAPSFIGEKVLAAILFERTMDGEVGGKPTPIALWDKGVVPFIKIDKGLEVETSGVQLMKPMTELSNLLTRAKWLGVFGTKERSVINSANRNGINAVVEQQFAIGNEVSKHGLMPMLEPEINIKSDTRAECDAILLEEIMKSLDRSPSDQKVMLKLSLPVIPGTFDPLIDHPKIVRVVALSGGFRRLDACAELVNNRGVIASFSRALLEDLRHQMSDAEFDQSLGKAIEEIYRASVHKA
jgi:fructose-bisphosphate aldolase, class I